MSTTTYWSPNQAAIKQVETYTFSAPNSIGNTYTATINGKSVTYTSISGDTAALAATGLFNLLNVSTSIAAELTEITFANPSSGVITATAVTAGTPFANITIGGVSGQGLVMSTGNGLNNGITTAHTTANSSPSDVNDPQNWLRVNTAVTPPSKTRAIPQNGDDVVVAHSSVPMLWNLDRLSAVQFNTYTRFQSFTGTIGLPDNNPNGYIEWRATYFKFSGPTGSVPAGGLQVVLGQFSQVGTGPTRERYDFGSQHYTLTALAAGTPDDSWGIRILGYQSVNQNTITVLGNVSVGVAMYPGEVSNLGPCTVSQGGILGVGPGVTWNAGATLTVTGGTTTIASSPTTLALAGGSQATITVDSLTWPYITAQGGSSMTWLAGGIITNLTMTTSSTLDKSQDARSLTITNSTMDGDSCIILDPLNAITFTNATTIKQSVSSGPIQFTGPRTMKVT